MTWAEFQLRSYAYKRKQERQELLFREVAWNALIGSHYNAKKLPKTKDRFWQIGEKKSVTNDKMKAAILQAQKQYFEDKKKIENG